MTEILKCPLLPDVEPRPKIAFTGLLAVVANSTAGARSNQTYIEGPLATSPDEAVALWNAWMQPLHDLQAERDQFNRIAMDAVEMNVQQASRLAALEAENERLRAENEDMRETLKSIAAYPMSNCDLARGYLT